MTEQFSIAEARRNLAALVRGAENGKAVGLTRRGEPATVLVGRREFKRSASHRRGFADAWREFGESVDLAERVLDPDELFADARDEGIGQGHFTLLCKVQSKSAVARKPWIPRRIKPPSPARTGA